ncbi:MAG TPA: HD domain-containing protein [Thermoanaerobaculia bacterium]|nr:HD domain-containing protein [Thermoanaerobaculia bacterium]HUM29245.1 HD domain-containing protein [Thermoanaerobaculia bacterium]HXK67797.1 HD domain-containing protein [Thermoanaerobaculia bacterium]
MNQDLRVSLFEIVSGVADIADSCHPALRDHHARVALLSCFIGREMGLGQSVEQVLILAGLLHDVGALGLEERLDLLEFEADFDISPEDTHARQGAWLVDSFPPLHAVSRLIRDHHARWDQKGALEAQGLTPAPGTFILHLADRVSVLLNRDRPVIQQVEHALQRVMERSGSVFWPEAVDALGNLARFEHLWMEILHPNARDTLNHMVHPWEIVIDLPGLFNLGEMLTRVVDFRSPFTAGHSRTTGMVAEKLWRLAGFSEDEGTLIALAGFLHDLGKLAIPSEIIEKPAGLTWEERQSMVTHPYHTHRFLRGIKPLRSIEPWASFHHEHMDGSGYPFHVSAEDIPMESRIIAVADVFTALQEDRPYRQPRSPGATINMLKSMSERGALDGEVVSLVENNRDSLLDVRHEARKKASETFVSFSSQGVLTQKMQ